MTRKNAVGGDDRGVSEVVGYILLVGLVLTATAIAVAMGAEAIGGLESENDATSARAILEDVDAELETVATSSSAPSRTFDFSGTAGGHLQVQSGGNLTVSMMSVVDDTRCSTQTDLGTIRFEEDSRVVAYEAGGTWERAPGGGSAMITQPNIAFRDGTLEVDLVNVSGVINQGDTEATFNPTATRGRNQHHQTNLEACDSIKNATVTIESSFHEAWGEYLQEQTGGNLTQSDDDIVKVKLDSGDLPRRVDMFNNSVVNLNDSRPGVNITYMEDVHFREDPTNLTVDKDRGGDSEPYLVSVTALSDRPPRIGDVQTLQAANVSNRTRGPVDVAFVMDESSSMRGNPTDDAIDAGQAAVGTLNTSDIGDRAGIVGYHSWPRFTQPNGSYLTSNDTALNSTMDGLGPGRNCDTFTCNTDISSGLNGSLSILSYRETRNDGHVILMSDGANTIGDKDEYNTDFDDRTMNAARIAAARGHTVHAFAFGTGADEDLLEDIADESGGEFDASGDPDGLKDFFESVIEGITREDDYVTRSPLTTNMTSDGQANPPQIVGDTDSIANVSNANDQTFLNINDPTSPTLFSHSFAVDDGEPVAINATKYDCADDGWRDTGGSTDVDGTTYPIARCTEMVSTNETLEDDRIDHYLNGSDVTSLRTNDDINGSLAPYTTNMSGTHRLTNLSSNQVLINLNFSRDPESGLANNLVLLYEIGLSEEEASGANVINVRESTVTLD